jgi:hypothetical protein
VWRYLNALVALRSREKCGFFLLFLARLNIP